MKYNPSKHHRRSMRLRGYDYSSSGAYFVTANVQDRLRLFGTVHENGVELNDTGKIARQCWEDIPIHFPHVELDEFIIMPDHMHGIIFILPEDDNRKGVPDNDRGRGVPDNDNRRGVLDHDNRRGVLDHDNRRGLINQAPTNPIPRNQTSADADWPLMKNPKQTLGKIVRWYKARATKMIRDSGENGFQWQRNYHDRIIRTEHELIAIREYIINNPTNWWCDKRKSR